MSLLYRLVVFFGTVFAVIGVDQYTKQIAVNRLMGQPPHIYLNDMARLLYAENTGAFLSLGARLPEQSQRWVFVGFVTLILLALLIFAMKEIRTISYPLLIGFALILGGGLGNLIDRVVNNGRVVDFMNVGIGGLRTGIFNVADMALMAGVAMVMIFGLFTHPQPVVEPDSAEVIGAGEP